MTDNIVDTGLACEVFATSLVKVERIGKSSVRRVFANPDALNCKVVNLKGDRRIRRSPDIIRALQNIDIGGGMSPDAPASKVMHS